MQSNQSKHQTKMQLQSAEISAGDVGVGAIGQRNARPPTMQCNSADKKEEICVDGVEVVVAGVVDEVTAHRLMLMLPCRCRTQVYLARLCNRVQVQPQCPRSRETE